MARIRTIKPEFWDSPSVAKASPWARLLFIAMWNWADDYGRGTANLKELEGFAFPNDDQFTDSSGNTVTFRSLVAEVSDCFGVIIYEVDGRPYFEIPTWDSHQRNEKRAKQSRYPDPPMVEPKFGVVAEIPSHVADAPRSSGPGTGEQGNRGTGEQGSRGGGSADAPPTPKCKKHDGWEHEEPCVTCRRDRQAAETFEAEQIQVRAAAKRELARNPFCPHGFPRHESCERCGEAWPA